MEAHAGNEELRAKLKALQYELDLLKQQREMTTIKHDRELRELSASFEERMKAQSNDYDDMTRLRQTHDTGVPRSKHEAAMSQLQETNDQAINAKLALERELRSAQAAAKSAEETASEASQDLASLERECQQRADDAEARRLSLQRTVDDLQSQLATFQRDLHASRQRESDSRAEIGRLEAQTLSLQAAAGNLQEVHHIKAELASQVEHVLQIEATNRQQATQLASWRQNRQNVDILEEEKRSLQTKLQLMDNLQQQLYDTQQQRDTLAREKSAWTSFLQNEHFKSPQDMARTLSQQRLENVDLQNQLGLSRAELIDKDARLEAAQQARRTSEQKVNGTTHRPHKALERQKALALKEVEFLREQLRSFDAEEQTFHSANAQFDAAKTQRITHLEQQLDEHRQELHLLTQQQEPTSPRKRSRPDESNGPTPGLQEALKDLSEIRTAHALLQADHSATQSQLNALQNSSRFRVLSLRSNPTEEHEAIKAETLRVLKAENADLLARLEGQDGQAAPASTLEALRLEVAEMQRTVADKDKRMLRLKQIWALKSLEFREAVFSLLGWRMDFRPNGKFALSLQTGSEKAGEEVQETLVFDGENGTMKVAGGMDSVFARQLRPLTKEWVEGKRYIPGLMASVLLSKIDDGTVSLSSTL